MDGQISNYDACFQNRFAWYMSLSALHGDEEFQRRGVVEVFFCSGALEQKDAIVDHMTKGMGGLMCLPIRFAGIHFCYDEPALTPLLRLAQMAFGASNRLRLQPHQGKNRRLVILIEAFCIIPEL